VLIGAQAGKQGPRGVDRFKIDGVSATAAVPEPAAALLGLVGMAGLLRRHRQVQPGQLT
jgi:MYXO-CTERM domain-containing protein